MSKIEESTPCYRVQIKAAFRPPQALEFGYRLDFLAIRDKKRDRHILLRGTNTPRFTGSEIHKNPYDCASEAIDQIRKLEMGVIHVEGPKG